MQSDSPAQIGIVGLGGIGHYHADLLADQPAADLVGGVDISGDARRAFSEKYNVSTYEQVDDLLEVADALFVTTPNRFHEEYTIDALEAGLDVLLEKPLAHTLESAERIVEAAHAAEGFCMVGFNNRFSAPVEVVKQYQADGRFGKFSHIEANYVRRRGIPGRGSWFTSKEVAGGGSLIDIGVHAIDLALYFLDFPRIAEVSGTARSQFGTREDYAFVEMWGDDIGPQGFDVDDSVSAFIRTAKGQTISLDVAWAVNRPTNDEFVLRGTEAGAKFDRSSHELTIYEDSKAGRDHLTDAEIETRASDTHKAEQRYFIDHIGSETTPQRNTVDEGLAVQKVIDAIYRSSEEGRAISLD
jgi:predicted dehydrogenase